MHHQNNQQNPCLSTFKPTYCENLRLTHRDLIDLFEDGTHIENNFLDLASFSRSHKRQPWLFLLSAAKEIGAPNSFVSEFFITIYFQAPASRREEEEEDFFVVGYQISSLRVIIKSTRNS